MTAARPLPSQVACYMSDLLQRMRERRDKKRWGR
jgi:hypothetical protein